MGFYGGTYGSGGDLVTNGNIGPGSMKYDTSRRVGGGTTAVTGMNGQTQMDRLLMEYLMELKKPLDMNDPYVKQYLMSAQNDSQKRARLQGIEGPLSNLNTEHAFGNAVSQLEQQRRGLFPNALSMGLNRDQFYQQQQLADILRQYEAGKGQAQGVGGLLGGIGGGLIGGIATGGNPMGISAGAGMGSQIGGGIGGLSYGPPPSPYSSYRGGF